MISKFKEGDRVRVVRICGPMNSVEEMRVKVGDIGLVTEIDTYGNLKFPIRVKFKYNKYEVNLMEAELVRQTIPTAKEIFGM